LTSRHDGIDLFGMIRVLGEAKVDSVGHSRFGRTARALFKIQRTLILIPQVLRFGVASIKKGLFICYT